MSIEVEEAKALAISVVCGDHRRGCASAVALSIRTVVPLSYSCSFGAQCLCWLAGALLSVGCGGTDLRVQVLRAHDRRPVADASVLLYDIHDEPCRDNASGGQLTDERGEAEVKAPFCGSTKLWVSAEGFEQVIQKLDSCEQRTIQVALKLAAQGAVSRGCAK
jgi:hypothetical protein